MIRFRKAGTNEAEIIVAFQQLMAKETEGLHLEREILKSGVQAVFDDASKGIYYVAEKDNEVIASLLTTFEWSDWRNGTVLWIQSVYVKPGHRGQGVFHAMYKALKKEAEGNSHIKGIRLYVDKGNSMAQKVYDAIGMNGQHYQLYEWMC